jgi:hypothetical protein
MKQMGRLFCEMCYYVSGKNLPTLWKDVAAFLLDYAVSNHSRCIMAAAGESRRILHSQENAYPAAFRTSVLSGDVYEIGYVRYQVKWVKCNLFNFLFPSRPRDFYLQALCPKFYHVHMLQEFYLIFHTQLVPVPHSFYVILCVMQKWLHTAS